MKKMMLYATFAIIFISAGEAATTIPKFSDYAVAIKPNTANKMPDFNGRDRRAKDFRTRIMRGIESGPNFAGHFSIIEIGCGTGCEFVYAANNENGEVIDFPIGGEDYQLMQLKFKINSRLVVASYILNGICMVSYFEFRDRSFRELWKDSVQPIQKCHDQI